MLFGRRRIEKRHNFPRMRLRIDRRRSRQQVLGGSRSHSLPISRHDTTRIAIWTLYLRTLCFGTIVPDLVLDLGSAGWVIPSRYIQSPQPSRPRSLLLRLGPLLSDMIMLADQRTRRKACRDQTGHSAEPDGRRDGFMMLPPAWPSLKAPASALCLTRREPGASGARCGDMRSSR